MIDSSLSTSQAYSPPYPPRPIGPQSPYRILRSAQRNLLSVWPDHTYSGGSFSYKILGLQIHVCSTPDVVRQVFVDNAAAYSRKTQQQRNALGPLAGDGLIISDGDVWRRHRRAVAPVTHVSHLPELSRAMSNGAEALRQQWATKAPGTEVDFIDEMAHLAANIIIAAIFGPGVDPEAASRIVRSFSVYQRLVKQLDWLSLFGIFNKVPRFGGLRASIEARRIRRDLDRMIDTVLAGDQSETSLIRAMSEATVDGKPAMDRNGFRDEAAVMFIAGHETTANTLAWAFFILSQDPDSERRLHAEVDEILGDRPADFEDLAKLPFTKAVIQETLRLYPPVPIQARVATIDTQIGQKQVKAGDMVLLNAWILHRHREVWSDPDAFVPDRFMPGGSGPPSRYAYVPFSIGPRTCTGAAFGQAEAIICLATLARRFRPRLRHGFEVKPVCRLSLRPGHHLPMTLERRT